MPSSMHVKAMAGGAFNILRQHFGIYPLMGAVTFVGSMGVGALTYTALVKNDVTFNRWNSNQLFETVDWDNVREKMLPRRLEIEAHRDNPALRELLKEVYADGRYNQ